MPEKRKGSKFQPWTLAVGVCALVVCGYAWLVFGPVADRAIAPQQGLSIDIEAPPAEDSRALGPEDVAPNDAGVASLFSAVGEALGAGLAMREQAPERSSFLTRLESRVVAALYVFRQSYRENAEREAWKRAREAERKAIRAEIAAETPDELLSRLVSMPAYREFTPHLAMPIIYSSHLGGNPLDTREELFSDPRVSRIREILIAGSPEERETMLALLKEYVARGIEDGAIASMSTAVSALPMLLAEAAPDHETLELVVALWRKHVRPADDADVWIIGSCLSDTLYLSATSLLNRFGDMPPESLTAEQTALLAEYHVSRDAYHESIREWLNSPEMRNEIASSPLASFAAPGTWPPSLLDEIGALCLTCPEFRERQIEVMRQADAIVAAGR